MTETGGATTGDEGDEGDGRRVRLLVVWEHGCASYVLGPREEVVLGRRSDSGIVIDLASVSRRHARIVAAGSDARPGELALVEDLGGMNGVRVRGQRLAPGLPVAAAAGDVVELGGAVVLFHPPHVHGASAGGAVARVVVDRPAAEDGGRSVDRLLEVVAESELPVLLVGEDGIGKTHAAEAIHARSQHAAGALVRVVCRGRYPDVIVRDLFGGEAPGAFERAGAGSVLLEDVHLLPAALQARLVATLAGRAVTRGESAIPYTARVLATSALDLVEEQRAGRFRRDLHEALGGVTLALPPLRERPGEISRFAMRFLAAAAERLGRPMPRLSNEALGLVLRHPYPGNLRELRSTMERACALAGPGFIGPEHVIFETRSRRDLAQTAPAIPAGVRTPRVVTLPTEAPDAPADLEETPIPKASRPPE